MKCKQFKILFLLLLFSNLIAYSQYLEFSPSSAHIYIDSGEIGGITVALSTSPFANKARYSYGIFPIIADEGFILSSPSGGIINAPFSAIVHFYFSKHVTETTTVLYRFNTQWNVIEGGVGAGTTSINIYVTYRYICEANINITQNVNSGQTDIQESSSAITASNTIFNGGIAEYDTGNTIFLKPNFHAKSGSTFRAYIAGCTSGNQIIEKSAEGKNIENTVVDVDKSKYIKVYPNPTKNELIIESTSNIVSWKLTNYFGESYYKGSEVKRTLDVSRLPNGIYFLKAILRDGSVLTKKIIKN